MILGVIGNPVKHSLSPLIHRGWLRDQGISGNYMGLRVDDGDFAQSIPMLENAGYTGLNVTLPHKGAAFEFAHALSGRAKAIGAVNTLTLSDGNWLGDNTDAPGFMAAINECMLGNLAGKSAVIIGAGGSAQAVAYALDQAGVVLTIVNRTAEKARLLATKFSHVRGHSQAPLSALRAVCAHADIVVNTTSIGHGLKSDPEQSQFDAVLDLGPGNERPFFDLSYGKIAAPLLAMTEAEGWASYDGLSMLVYQAAFAFEIWTGIKPDIEKALVRCRDALAIVS